jgi:hypothetical protein
MEYQKSGKARDTERVPSGSKIRRDRTGAGTADSLNYTVLCERGKYTDSTSKQATAASSHILRLQ